MRTLIVARCSSVVLVLVAAVVARAAHPALMQAAASVKAEGVARQPATEIMSRQKMKF